MVAIGGDSGKSGSSSLAMLKSAAGSELFRTFRRTELIAAAEWWVPGHSFPGMYRSRKAGILLLVRLQLSHFYFNIIF